MDCSICLNIKRTVVANHLFGLANVSKYWGNGPCGGSGPRPVKTSPQRNRRCGCRLRPPLKPGFALQMRLLGMFFSKGVGRWVCFKWLQSTKPIERLVSWAPKQMIQYVLGDLVSIFFSLFHSSIYISFCVFSSMKKRVPCTWKVLLALAWCNICKGKTWTVMWWRKSWTVLCHNLLSICIDVLLFCPLCPTNGLLDVLICADLFRSICATSKVLQTCFDIRRTGVLQVP